MSAPAVAALHFSASDDRDGCSSDGIAVTTLPLSAAEVAAEASGDGPGANAAKVAADLHVLREALREVLRPELEALLRSLRPMLTSRSARPTAPPPPPGRPPSLHADMSKTGETLPGVFEAYCVPASETDGRLHADHARHLERHGQGCDADCEVGLPHPFATQEDTRHSATWPLDAVSAEQGDTLDDDCAMAELHDRKAQGEPGCGLKTAPRSTEGPPVHGGRPPRPSCDSHLAWVHRPAQDTGMCAPVVPTEDSRQREKAPRLSRTWTSLSWRSSKCDADHVHESFCSCCRSSVSEITANVVFATRPSSSSRPLPYILIQRIRLLTKAVVRSSCFDGFITMCVLLNSISIGASSDYRVSHLDAARMPVAFDFVEATFSSIFILELILRMICWGTQFLRCPEWRWNLFDTVIVCTQLFEEAGALIGDGVGHSNLSFMRIVRMLRLVRILRLVRLLRFISELRTMVLSIASSFKSLCWTLVLLLLMMYVISICILQLIADRGREDETILDEEQSLCQYYGSLSRSVLSLYQAMTGGVDWDDLLQPLEEHISPWCAIPFSVYIAFAVLAMMNVVTGVFVDSALQTARDDREGEVAKQVKKLFRMTDVDHSGIVSWEEFNEGLSMKCMEEYLRAMDIEKSDARGLFHLMDTDGSGSINAEEFVQGCLRLRGPAKAIDVAMLLYCNQRMANWWQDAMGHVDTALDWIMDHLEGEIREDPVTPQPSCQMQHQQQQLEVPLLRGPARSMTESSKLKRDDLRRNRNLMAQTDKVFQSWTQLKEGAQKEGPRRASAGVRMPPRDN